jgi:hypothetical protein
LIFVRSRRSIVTLASSSLLCAIAFSLLAIAAALMPGGGVAGLALGLGALGAGGIAGWSGLQLRRWPSGRLGLFRDRMLVIQGRHEMRAMWDLMESVTLSDPDAWPSVRVTDRLTIHFRNEAPLGFRPALFGLEPVACRDLIVRLRDDARLRARLPEFDSARDLAVSPVVSGELTKPLL